MLQMLRDLTVHSTQIEIAKTSRDPRLDMLLLASTYDSHIDDPEREAIGKLVDVGEESPSPPQRVSFESDDEDGEEDYHLDALTTMRKWKFTPRTHDLSPFDFPVEEETVGKRVEPTPTGAKRLQNDLNAAAQSPAALVSAAPARTKSPPPAEPAPVTPAAASKPAAAAAAAPTTPAAPPPPAATPAEPPPAAGAAAAAAKVTPKAAASKNSKGNRPPLTPKSAPAAPASAASAPGVEPPAADAAVPRAEPPSPTDLPQVGEKDFNRRTSFQRLGEPTVAIPPSSASRLSAVRLAKAEQREKERQGAKPGKTSPTPP